ncbi:response regulator [Paenibacillus sp. Z6-24]
MIKAFLIDDEKLCLQYMRTMLQEIPAIKVVGECSDSLVALDAVLQLEPDVIFMDIVMPGISGLEIARSIRQLLPDTQIVFVTGSDACAVEAFEMNALDYLLKPVRQERLAKTVARLLPAAPSVDNAARLVVCCFKTLKLVYTSPYHAKPTKVPFRWRTSRAQAVFAYLLHYRGTFVSKDALLHEFWPFHDVRKGSSYLYTTIYHIRQSIKQNGLHITIDNSNREGYTLRIGDTLIDVDQFEQGIRELGAVTMANYANHQSLSNLYTGDYLTDHDFEWAAGERQRLSMIWLNHAIELGIFYTESLMFSAALSIYQRMIQLHPYVETGHWGVMRTYAGIGSPAEVVKQFQSSCHLFQQDLGIELSSDLKNWYRQWQDHNAYQLPPH